MPIMPVSNIQIQYQRMVCLNTQPEELLQLDSLHLHSISQRAYDKNKTIGGGFLNTRIDEAFEPYPGRHKYISIVAF